MKPEIKAEKNLRVQLGWKFEGTAQNGHYKFTHPEWGTCWLPFSPSDPKWKISSRRQLAQRMGISMAELSQRLGEYDARSRPAAERKKRRRRKKAPRPVRRTEAKAKPEVATATDWRDGAEKTVQEVNEEWERQQGEVMRARSRMGPLKELGL